MASTEKRRFNKRLTGKARTDRQLQQMRREQKDRSELRWEQDFAEFVITHEGPFHIVHLSDIHFGSDAVDYDYLDQVFEYILHTPNVYVMLYGDLLEGFNKEYVDSNSQHVLIPLHDQVITFRERYLKPLYEKNKIMGMVSRFTESHEGWTLKSEGLDLYPLLIDSMDDLNLIGNGGILEIRVKGREEPVRIRCYHNPPKSGTDESPLSGLRKAEDSLPGYVDMVFAGDRHTLGGAIAVEKDPDGTIKVYGHIPPFKANQDSLMPDYFMMAKYGNRPSAPGGLSTLHGEYESGPYIHVARDLETATNIDRARRFSDVLDADPAAKEEIRQMMGNRGEMEVEFNPKKSKSRVAKDDQVEKSLVRGTFDVRNADFFIVNFISRFQAGSESSDQKFLEKYIDFVSSAPNSIVITGPGNIASSVVNSPKRHMIVEEYLKIMEPTFGMWAVALNDSIMTHEDWKKDVGIGPYMVGTVIRETSGAHLADPNSSIYFSMKDEYNRVSKLWSLLMLDGSGSRTSPKDPFRFGVTSEMDYRSEGSQHNIILSSRSPVGGVQSKYNIKMSDDQYVFSDPGFSTEVVINGKGNRKSSAEGGLGTILTSWGEVYPYISIEQGIELTRSMPEFAYAMVTNQVNSLIAGLEKKKKGRRR